MTVHKSQGSTLTRAELMVANAFDYGQTYVALSRVKSLEGLWLTKLLTKASIMAHPTVLEYYRTMQSLMDEHKAREQLQPHQSEQEQQPQLQQQQLKKTTKGREAASMKGMFGKPQEVVVEALADVQPLSVPVLSLQAAALMAQKQVDSR